MAHFINLETNLIEANVLVGARPRVAQFTPDGNQVWVSAEIGGTISVIDVASHRIVEEITFRLPGIERSAIQPVGLTITADGKRVFVALGPAARVAVVDVETYQVEKYLLVGQRVWNLDLTADERYLVSTNGVSNDVSIIDVNRLKVLKSIKVGRLPWGVVIKP